MPRGPGQGTWLGLPTVEGTQWANAHTTLAHKGAPSLRHTALPGSPPPTELPRQPARCSRRTRQCSALPSCRLSCRSQMEKSSQKHQPYHIGKTSSCSRIGLPSASSTVPQLQAKTMGAILGCMGVFKALAGPLPWGTRGLDLGKTFLKLLLPRLW